MDAAQPIESTRCTVCHAERAQPTPFCQACGTDLRRLPVDAGTGGKRRGPYLVEPGWVGPLIALGIIAPLVLLGWLRNPRDVAGAVQGLIGLGLLVGAPFLAGYYVRRLWPRVICFGLFALLTVLLGAGLVAALQEPADIYTAFALVAVGVFWAIAGGGFVLGGLAGGVVSLLGRRLALRNISTAGAARSAT